MYYRESKYGCTVDVCSKPCKTYSPNHYVVRSPHIVICVILHVPSAKPLKLATTQTDKLYTHDIMKSN